MMANHRHGRKIKAFSWIAPGSAVLATFVGLIALVGWATNYLQIARINSEYIPMAPATAICMVLLGAALLLRTLWPGDRAIRWIWNTLTAAALIFSGALLLQFMIVSLTDSGMDIEQFIVPATPVEQGFVIGRMSPLTALMFVLTAAAFLFSMPILKAGRASYLAAQSAAAVVLTMACILMVGYWYGAPLLYGGDVTPVALPTVIGFILLSAGLLFEDKSALFFRWLTSTSIAARLTRLIVPATSAIVLMAGWSLTVASSQLRSSEDVLSISMIVLLTAWLIAALMVVVARKLQAVVTGSEQSLREKQEFMEGLVESLQDGLSVISTDGTRIMVNQALVEMTGFSREELLYHPPPFPFWPPEHQEELMQAFNMLLRGELGERELVFMRKGGERFPILLTPSYMRDKKGEFTGYSVSIKDITGRKQAEQERNRQHQLLMAINRGQLHFIADEDESKAFDNLLADMLALTDSEYGFIGEVLYGPEDQPYIKNYAITNITWNQETREFYEKNAPDGMEFRNLKTLFGAALTTGEPVIANDPLHDPRRGGLPEGHPPLEAFLGVPISSAGKLVAMAGIANRPGGYEQDLVDFLQLFLSTVGQLVEARRSDRERQKAEEEKESLQGQLIQAQKMESVGRLAGGVAHDFNNMLGAILGHAELALRVAAAGTPLHESLTEIIRATERSANLTRQLLAFARRQIVNPRIIDLNEAVSGLLDMLQRLIGEDIELVWKPGPDLKKVMIDPGQIDQVLINLAVNARDAIEGVGFLSIETEDTVFDEAYCRGHAGSVPGDYVTLVVRDNGRGMDKEVLDQIYEPFFTTKETGKGTGLGLAMVYGVVKQNNGYINVYSEPGMGTTFRIYLPGAEGEEAKEPASVEQKPVRGTETILLVEDEEAILDIGQRVLGQAGYTVLAADTPGKAISLANEHQGTIHLMITDVIMPDMNGKDLSDRLKGMRPDIKVLFMSGYTADVIATRGVLEAGVLFLQKPFTVNELTAKVRDVLDS